MKLNIEERNRLVLDFVPLAESIAASRCKSYSYKNYEGYLDFEECKSIAYFGLVDAAARYDEGKGVFWKYATPRIHGAITDHQRACGFGSKGSNSRGCTSFESLQAMEEDERNQHRVGDESGSSLSDDYRVSSKDCSVKIKHKKMDQDVVNRLLERYNRLHPLILHRSVERARTVGELFDLLDGFPERMPVVWDEQSRSWQTKDLLLSRNENLV